MLHPYPEGHMAEAVCLYGSYDSGKFIRQLQKCWFVGALLQQQFLLAGTHRSGITPTAGLPGTGQLPLWLFLDVSPLPPACL